MKQKPYLCEFKASQSHVVRACLKKKNPPPQKKKKTQKTKIPEKQTSKEKGIRRRKLWEQKAVRQLE